MTVLTVPVDDELWPSLGGLVCKWIEANLVFGPGDLRGLPAVLDDEKRAFIWRLYEIYPQHHPQAGRRRFKRAAISLPKGSAKTEFAAWIAAAELHPDAPVRCVGWDANGQPIGSGVIDPYIPLVAYTEEQSDELCYGALKAILEEGPLRDDFDIGLERIVRLGGDGRAVSLASAPSARDGARTTFQVADEPLALDTPIPTPDGWSTMGELKPGDWVFGRDGSPCMVLGASDVHVGRPCYRVTFGDGTSIVADANHRWAVYDHSPSYRCERVVTTQFMRDHQWSSSRRFTVVESGALDLPDAELLVDPYTLGLWLGDGDSANATITVGHEDLEETASRLCDAGHVVTRCEATGLAPLLYVTYPDSRYSGWNATIGTPKNRSVVGDLRQLALLKNKHIPATYLRASRGQRLALLQGLMDADGHIDTQGRCTFVNANRQLIEDVIVLLRTLGYRPRPASEAVDHRWETPKTIYRVFFTGNPEMPPFRLGRKVARLQPRRRQTNPRSVVSVESVDSVPVRCIVVDSDDHLFLAGEGVVATHNTHWWTLDRLKRSHQTMLANLPKRRAADAWALEVTTAPEPGMGSVAESTMEYARQIADGKIRDARLFFYHRQAGDDHDLTTEAGARAAVAEASGITAEWRDVESIVELWRDPTTDRTYWERVWLNRLVQSSRQAFDVERWRSLARVDNPVRDGDLIVIGFDGAQFRDATALVATHVTSGYQWVLGAWESPEPGPGGPRTDGPRWQVSADDVTAVVDAAFERWHVWRLYADPYLWETTVAAWAGRYGAERVMEWWTTRRRAMTFALAAFETAIQTGDVTHSGDELLTRHLANAHRRDLPQLDEETGRHLWLISKERTDSPRKIDAAMAAVLSWECRRDAIAAGAVAPPDSVYETRGIFALT